MIANMKTTEGQPIEIGRNVVFEIDYLEDLSNKFHQE